MSAAPVRSARRALALALTACLSVVLATTSLSSPAGAAADPPRPSADERIVGGSSAQASTYPWFAQLQIQTQQGIAGCGGALVTPVIVLTAAHCLDGATGAIAAFGQNQTGQGGQVVEALGATIAADYSQAMLDNDYGFLALAQPVTAYPTIKLAGPSETALWRPGRVGRAMGFGHVSEGGPASPTLQDVALPVLDNGVCGAAASYGTTFRPASMLCVGYREGGRSTCQGDSGGPLVVPGDGGVWRIAGLVSFALGCARPGYPTVFTRAGDPAYGARIQLALNDYKNRNPQFFPGVYSNTDIIGSGARPAGCGAAQAKATKASRTAAKRTAAFQKANKALNQAKKQQRATLQYGSPKQIKAANAKVAKATKKVNKSRKAAVAAGKKKTKAVNAANAACR